MPSPWSYEDMLAEFRSLGGIADNVEMRKGEYGFGMFPVDPTLPVKIHAPESMLVPCRYVQPHGNDLVISPECTLDDKIKDFFTRYQREFSWGGEARTGVEHFHKQFSELPDGIIDALAQIGIQIDRPLGKEWSPFELFKMTRTFTYHDEPVFMPVIDLLNHGREAKGFETSNGIGVSGTFSGEVLVHYGPADSLGRFFSQQFINDEMSAFSLTITIPMEIGGKSLLISRRICDKQAKNSSSLLPIIQEEGNCITLSHLMLGNERMPRLPRTLFRQLLPTLTSEQADELFQRIVNTNILLLIGLLDALDTREEDLALQLRMVARLQLKGIAQSYGARS